MITLSPAGPWDFINHFPAPLPEVVEAGKIDSDADGIASIFAEHTHEVVAILQEIIYLRECKKLWLNPITSRASGKRSKPIDLKKLIRQQWRNYRDAIAVIVDAFGRDAANQYKRFCVALSEGVLIVKTGSDTLHPTDEINQITDDDEKQAKWTTFFDSYCPAVWTPGQRTWNADKVERYPASFQTSYQPDHPFYYHQAGRPLAPEALMELHDPIDSHDLGDYLFGKNRKRDFEAVLNRYRQRMTESTASYTILYAHGPKGLSDYTKTNGNYGKTPMTIWGESMALLARQIMHQASVVHTIDMYLVHNRPELQIKGIGEQMEMFG